MNGRKRLFHFAERFISVSISATTSLIFTSSAVQMRYKVSNVGIRSPRSTALRWLLPISARPLTEESVWGYSIYSRWVYSDSVGLSIRSPCSLNPTPILSDNKRSANGFKTEYTPFLSYSHRATAAAILSTRLSLPIFSTKPSFSRVRMGCSFTPTSTK